MKMLVVVSRKKTRAGVAVHGVFADKESAFALWETKPAGVDMAAVEFDVGVDYTNEHVFRFYTPSTPNGVLIDVSAPWECPR